MLDLSQIPMHDRTIDDWIVVRPKNHVSDFIWGNESTETIHGAEVIENALVVANVLAQHGGVDAMSRRGDKNHVVTGKTGLGFCRWGRAALGLSAARGK